MCEDMEKQTTTALGTQTGEIPTTLRLLAISLDKTFEGIYEKFDDINKKTAENQKEIMDAIETNKTHIDQQCKVCRLDVDKKFDSLRILIFLNDNPKMFKLIAALVALVVILAGVGSEKVFTSFIKIIS